MRLSAPAKLILFGEWAVTRGHPGLATALESRFTADYAPAPGGGLALNAGDRELRLSSPEQALPPFWKLAVEGWKCLELPFEGRVRLERAWRVDEGLGSSSALLVSLVGLAAGLGCGPFDGRPAALAHGGALWRETRSLIRRVQSPRASGLDAAAQTWGGSVVLEGDDVTPLFIDRPREIVVLHTGRKMDTAAALNDRRPEESDMKLLGESCRRFLGERDWIRAMDEHARVLERSGVVPAFVSETSRAWKAAGLVRALKTTGAGGGDALLAWSPVDKHATLRAEAERLGWWLSPLAWNAEGLREETAS